MININEHSLDESLFQERGINFIDLGACLGEFSSSVYQKYLVKKAVLIEANPTNFSKIPNLANSEKLNRFITPEEIEEGIVFYEDEGSPYNGSAFFTNKFAGKAVQHIIPSISLSSIVNSFNGERIDFVKMDIEGGEFPLITQCDPKVFSNIKQLTIEFHDFLHPDMKPLAEKCCAKLLDCGFELVIAKPANFMYGSQFYDTLFINKNL